jgi:hypothetical protein
MSDGQKPADGVRVGSMLKGLIAVCVVFLFVIVVGCGIYGKKAAEEYGVDEEQEQQQEWAGTEQGRVVATTGGDVSGSVAGKGVAFAATAASMERKIIKNGDIELHVADLDASVEQVAKLVEGAGGFVASQDFYAQPGSWRRCSLTVRVPGGEFDKTLAELQKHGEVWRLTIGTQDVTEEFVDLEARLRNSEREEGVLLDLLERRTPKLADVLEVERELSRVRGDIERAQGRRRYLTERVSLSTIDIELTEIGEAAVGPTGKWRLRFHVLSAGRVLVNAARAATTAIIYIAIVGAPVWVVLAVWAGARRRRRRRADTPQ